MCIAMLVFTLIIIISSFTRMTLYQQNYGHTRLRILVDFTLITEIILLVPTAIYVIKSKVNLAKAYLIIITTMYCVVNFANIDNFIAKSNIDRYMQTGKIDLYYLTRELDSADTVKQLKRLQEMKFEYTKDDPKTIYNELKGKIEQLDTYLSEKTTELNEDSTWTEFNLSRYRAKQILGGN